MNIEKIIIPTKLQTDTLVALFVLRKFGKEKFLNIENSMIEISSVLTEGENGNTLLSKGVLCVDVGGGDLDHHGKEKTTSSYLVSKFLNVEKDEALKKLLSLAERCDFYGKGTLSQDPLDKTFGLTGLLLQINNYFENDPNKVFDSLFSVLDAHYKEESKRIYEFPKIIEEKKKTGDFLEFFSQHRGRKIAGAFIKTDNTSISGYLRAMSGGNFDIVVLQLSTGHINILTRPSSNLDLRSLSVIVRKSEAILKNIEVRDDMEYLSSYGRLEELPQWYYDTATNSLQNGGISPSSVTATEIKKDNIIDLIKIGLSEELWSPLKNGYIAVFLDNASKEKLKKMAIYPEVFADHLTLAYRPDTNTYEKYKKDLGKEIELKVGGIAKDNKCQALVIEGIESENQNPHITISCNGVKPNYSNEMLKRAKIEKIDIQSLKGAIKFYEF